MLYAESGDVSDLDLSMTIYALKLYNTTLISKCPNHLACLMVMSIKFIKLSSLKTKNDNIITGTTPFKVS